MLRRSYWLRCATKERAELFDGFLNRFYWIEVFYAWRPNLPEEADNHLIELGVPAQTDAIVTRNLRDVARGELKVSLAQSADT